MSDWNYARWAHAQGHENLKYRLGTGDLLLAQANVLLTVLLVGVGGSLTYAIKLADPAPHLPATWGAAAVTAWLAVITVVLAFECVATRFSDVVGNEPDNIYIPGPDATEVAVLEFELSSIQRRIASTKARNASVAWWLDWCRYAAVSTPCIFMLTVWVAGGR